ncbi:MAG: lysophospholipid acyltransferase family protein [Gammaproteobacteria bacterium]
MLHLRSALYAIGFFITCPVYAVLCVLLFFLPFPKRHAFVAAFSDGALWWLKVTCGLTYRVEGKENLPSRACVVMSNHQSTWETLAFNQILPPLAWVIKRELLWIPFFGWAFSLMKPIGIDRSAGQKAGDQLIEQGRERLARGLWILVFPEGTRVAVGEKRRYKPGGARLACAAGVPVVPVAHDAGHYWPRRGFIKLPGTINVSIGPPIDTAGKTPDEVTEQVREWVQGSVTETVDG